MITPRVWRWLRSGRPTRILHLFEGVCNLVDDHDEVISLVAPRIGPGPFTIVLEDEPHGAIEGNQPITIDGAGETIALGSSVIDIRKAVLWQPKPDWSRLRAADVGAWSPPVALAAELEPALKQTIAGIVVGDSAACLEGARGLAGRGGGLTPAGDDVLMGLLYGLWVWYPRRQWIEMIAEAAIPHTTTLSASFLRAAAEGEAVWQWHDLVDNGPPAIAEILAIGHTSGADALAGFAVTGSMLRAALEKDGG